MNSLQFSYVSHSAHMLEDRKVYTSVSLETVPKYANIKSPTSSPLYDSHRLLGVGLQFVLRVQK